MHTNSVPALISKNVGNTLTNYKTWGGIVFNVKDYGAKGDGNNDDTAKIQKAIDAATDAGGGIVRFPSGNFKCDTITITGNNVVLQGSGNGTKIYFTGTTTNWLQLRVAGFILIEDMQIEALNNPTAGSLISMDYVAWVVIRNVTMGYYSKIWNGISLTTDSGFGSQSVYLQNCKIYKNQGVGILLENKFDTTVINDIFIENCWVQWLLHSVGDQPTSSTIGIKLNRILGSLQAINITNSEFISSYFSLHSNASRFVKITDCYFDSYTYIDGMTLSKFEGCWFSGATGDNPTITAHDYRNMLSVKFTKCVFDPDSVLNPTGSAIALQGNGKDVLFEGCTVAGGAHRGFVISGGDNIVLRNNYIANNPNIPNTQNMTVGIQMNNTLNGAVIIDGNDLRDMTTPIVTNAADNTKVRITNNLGFNPIKTLTPDAMLISGGTYTNTTTVPLRIYVSGGTGVVVFINNIDTGLSSGAFHIEPGETIAFLYTTPPSWMWQGL